MGTRRALRPRVRARWRAPCVAAAYLSFALPVFAEEPGVAWEDAPAPPPQPAPSTPPPQAPPQPARPVAIAVPPPAPPRALPSVPTRRAVELVPELALAWTHCASGDVSNDRCDGVRGGGEAAFSAFWRFSPYVAAGGGFELAGFRYEPPAGLDITSASAAGVFLGFLGRAYFLDHGSVDPYAQLGIGGGILGTAGRKAGRHFDETGAGPALQLGGGVDFFVSTGLKLGPSLSYTHVFVDKIRHCESNDSTDCSDISKDQSGHLDSFFTVGVRLTILLGSEM